ncbi:hypothetical protein [Tateyamaria sp. ANG-S1]|uniref:hypothetical protein n=1 Tax=Tateyamaria sp. ANG-S1 TaxID=1577905 RepID=UPI001F4CC781|nr:hypothetical protein [Tateyamaria sp. ANG-S1]
MDSTEPILSCINEKPAPIKKTSKTGLNGRLKAVNIPKSATLIRTATTSRSAKPALIARFLPTATIVKRRTGSSSGHRFNALHFIVPG